jgi:hypothetical protein
MQITQAKKVRGPAWTRVGLRVVASLALFAAGLTIAIVFHGTAPVVLGMLLASAGLTAWMAVLVFDMSEAGRTRHRERRVRRRPTCRKSRVVAPGDHDDARIRPGDYFSTGRSLYRVEHLAGARVLIEDCRSGDFLDVDRETCAALKRVRPAADRVS